MSCTEKQSDDYLVLGKISAVFGVKGWVKVFSHTAPRLGITGYGQWWLKKESLGENRNDSAHWTPVNVLQGRVQGKSIVAQLEGVTERTQAEALIGAMIAIKSDQLEKLPQGEYYWKDLIGLQVETVQGEKLGKIDWVFDTGSNDVIVVKGSVKDSQGSDIDNRERMIPFLMNDVVKSVDLEKSLMIVDWDADF